MQLPPFLTHNSSGWCQFWFMVILFLSFYHPGTDYFLAPFLGIWFSGLTWRIWILFYFWCWTIFQVWRIPIWSFSSFNFIWLIWVKIHIEVGLNGTEPQSYLIFRTDLKNLDPFPFLMLDDFSGMKNSNLIFFKFQFYLIDMG